MKTILSLVTLLSAILMQSVFAQTDWPVLKHYDKDHLHRIALPVGGIGTGTISIGGIGDLRDWEIVNRPAKGFTGVPKGNRAPFFAIQMKGENTQAATRALMGPVDPAEYEDKQGQAGNNHGLPRFRECSFDAAYPFGQVNLSDPDLPVRVKLQTFNPLIPADVDRSSFPLVMLRYEVTNTTSESLEVSVCGSFENFIGIDGSENNRDWKGDLVSGGAKDNRNEFRDEGGLKGVFMYSAGIDTTADAWGTMALSTPENGQVTYRTALSQLGWGNDILDFWDDFSVDGLLTEKDIPGGVTPRASLAVKQTIPANSTRSYTFYITWHFPNRRAWANVVVGNHYTGRYRDAWDVVTRCHPEMADLESQTIRFVEAFIQSDLPETVKEAALFNMSTLRSQTCFRTPDGLFFGWEGCNDLNGCCFGSCTHVWNYEQTTPFIFGELASIMRQVEFGPATNDIGLMSFRVQLPIEQAQGFQRAAADGQLGTLMKLYRDWQLSGNNEMLQRLWPNARKALEFCWIEGGWDENKDGVMEGAQHNTMDVEYFGPNPQMQVWYLGALRATEEMAIAAGDKKFAAECRQLYQNGSQWTDDNLFNGEYYYHRIKVPEDPKKISPYLMIGMGSKDLANPAFQLGEGCLVDQLAGQYMAHICGLGYLTKPSNVRSALQSIMKYNHKSSMNDHFNNMRSYALGNESALLMASFPHSRPQSPFPYFSEAMTGFEYTAAVGMLYENLKEDGLKVISNIRDRYDGLKRSPFDEAECGHHYARAMAAYAGVLALTGFRYSAITETMNFNDIEGRYFWANGYSYGTVDQKMKGTSFEVTLKVLGGRSLQLRTYSLDKFGEERFRKTNTIEPGSEMVINIKSK